MKQDADASSDQAGAVLPSSLKGRIAVLLRDGNREPEVMEALKAIGDADVQFSIRSKVLRAPDVEWTHKPRVVLLEAELSDPEDLSFIGDLKDRGLAVIALADRSAESAAIKAVRAGADDVLLMPIDPGELKVVFARLGRSITKQESAGTGKLIAFMHSSGGAGATTLAVNAACALSSEDEHAHVGLLDFDIQFGNAADLLDLPLFSRIEDILEDSARLDHTMLTAMMARHRSGVRVLTAPRVPLPLSAMTSESVSAIIEVAKRSFDYTVVDLPTALETWTDKVLREADSIYVVCPQTVPGVHRLSKLLTLLRQEGLDDLPLKIVLNRYQKMSNATSVALGQVTKALNRNVDHFIPNDYKLIALSQNEGQAAVNIKPRSRFANAVNDMIFSDLGRRPATRSRWSFLFGGQ